MVVAYKVFRVRRDGSLGPLFIDRSRIVRTGEWVESWSVPTKGFSLRPGWHAASTTCIPHIKLKPGRRMYRVLLRGVAKHHRPESQGGLWYTAKKMKVMEPVTGETAK